MSAFEAKYHGCCNACGEFIEPGQTVTYNEDHELIHWPCLSLIHI